MSATESVLRGLFCGGVFSLLVLVYGVRSGEAYVFFRPLFVGAAILILISPATLLIHRRISRRRRRILFKPHRRFGL